jgi:hypothetical protein
MLDQIKAVYAEEVESWKKHVVKVKKMIESLLNLNLSF